MLGPMNGRGLPRVPVAAVAAVLAAVLVAVPVPPTPARAEVVPDPCASELSVAHILEVTEEKRAGCFGRGSITFDTYAGTVMTVLPAVPSEAFGITWALYGPDLGAAYLLAFQPAGVRIPDGEDTPWAGRDGVPPDTYWTVTGHFADPASATCSPGDAVTGAGTAEAAVAWCRNQFVLEAMVWRPAGAGWRPAPDATPAAPLPTAAPADPAAVTGGAPGLLILAGTLVAGLAIIGAAAVAGRRVRRDGSAP